MKFVLTFAAVACATLFTTATIAGVKHENAPGRNVERTLTPSKSFTTKARVAYYYTGGSSDDRSKNVNDFENPSTGVFCILPSISLDLSSVFPIVSLEWGHSTGLSFVAFWQNTAYFSDCPANYAEVKTYDTSSGTPQLTNDAAFDFLIE